MHYESGVLAPDEPQQQLVEKAPCAEIGGYKIASLASYTIAARVLGSRRYRHEEAHELVPIDLVLGWGRMSDESVLSGLEISQGFRFYFYQWRGQPPIPRNEIATHSANVHVIPASPQVEQFVFNLPTGAIIKLTGDLVEARGPQGRVWSSSLTREDTGAGACELMYVRSAERITPLKPALD
ncbi:MAG: hypothetical protein JWM88_3367 [Verrucomicrobia bacterium]|nr:hypothetical protein [Verrucomicrobiota bacterium]